ncbi:MAG: hypothetical protein IT454_04220 [Planctomycetes bacterium]|nr:hypothetical protein [Planctomycetota bacterium]
MAGNLHFRAAALIASGLLCACSGGNGGGSTDADAVAPGTLLTNPDTGLRFVAEANERGQAPSLRLLGVSWGRLVDVYDFDAGSGESHLVMRDAVVDPLLEFATQDHRLDTDGFDGASELHILYPASSASFHQALSAALDGLQPIDDKGLDPTELPPWTAVPRNAALVLRFNDLLDPSSVDATSVRLLAGYTPNYELNGRVLPDPTHGALKGGAFRATRVIYDTTVSEAEGLASGVPVQMAGLPEALTSGQPNLLLSLPAQANPLQGQSSVLRNLGGRALGVNLNGPIHATAAGSAVARVFRSRGRSTVTGDPGVGYLADPSAPFVVGNHPVQLTFVAPGSAPGKFRVDIQFQVPGCAPIARENDRMLFAQHSVRVLSHNVQPVAGLLSNIEVQVMAGNPSSFGLAAGKYADRFTGVSTQIPECYLSFSPAAAQLPNARVSKDAIVSVRFNEPIDASSVRALDTLTVSYGGVIASPLHARVVGDILPDNALQTMLFVPRMPLRHASGAADAFTVDVLGGLNGVRDLAGNALAAALHASFTLDPAQSAVDSGSVALRFDGVDEDGDGNPEVRGGVLFDIVNHRVLPRPVTRFSALADTVNPVVGAMVQFAPGVTTPLTHYGSRAAMLWRYHDLGFELRDESTHDLDVEGLNWSPVNGATSAETFAQFEVALAHSKFLPDEALSSGLLPTYSQSGLTSIFANNQADALNDPLTVVHPRSRGYTVDPTDVFTATNGAALTPWPLNQGVPQSQFTYWTWRDTSKLALGGPNGDGADTHRLQQVTKTAQTKFYPASKVPTIALPLLMEFRTFPDGQTNSTNHLRVALAINSSARPYFRAHSTGGVNPNNPAQIKIVDPDQEPVATGGFAASGGLANPMDNVFAFGQADFVYRVSRMHTRWLDTGALGTTFADPFLELGGALPAGAQVVVAVRGANSIQLSNPPAGVLPYANANNLDAYGDGHTAAQNIILGRPSNLAFTPSFANTPPAPLDRSWKSTIGAINGARFVQARVTFVSNATTGLSGSLSALGFAYRR